MVTAPVFSSVHDQRSNIKPINYSTTMTILPFYSLIFSYLFPFPNTNSTSWYEKKYYKKQTPLTKPIQNHIREFFFYVYYFFLFYYYCYFHFRVGVLVLGFGICIWIGSSLGRVFRISYVFVVAHQCNQFKVVVIKINK